MRYLPSLQPSHIFFLARNRRFFSWNHLLFCRFSPGSWSSMSLMTSLVFAVTRREPLASQSAFALDHVAGVVVNSKLIPGREEIPLGLIWARNRRAKLEYVALRNCWSFSFNRLSIPSYTSSTIAYTKKDSSIAYTSDSSLYRKNVQKRHLMFLCY